VSSSILAQELELAAPRSKARMKMKAVESVFFNFLTCDQQAIRKSRKKIPFKQDFLPPCDQKIPFNQGR